MYGFHSSWGSSGITGFASILATVTDAEVAVMGTSFLALYQDICLYSGPFCNRCNIRFCLFFQQWHWHWLWQTRIWIIGLGSHGTNKNLTPRSLLDFFPWWANLPLVLYLRFASWTLASYLGHGWGVLKCLKSAELLPRPFWGLMHMLLGILKNRRGRSMDRLVQESGKPWQNKSFKSENRLPWVKGRRREIIHFANTVGGPRGSFQWSWRVVKCYGSSVFAGMSLISNGSHQEERSKVWKMKVVPNELVDPLGLEQLEL